MNRDPFPVENDTWPAKRRRRTLRLLAAVTGVATIGVAAACGGGGAGGAGPSGDGGAERAIAGELPDSIVRVVEQGSATHLSDRHARDLVGFGFVVENVSDRVALNVRVEVDLLDEAGDPLELSPAPGSTEFSVILPGQRLGSGGYVWTRGATVGGVDAQVTLITALDDTLGPYAELEVSEPPADPAAETYEVSLTNTYARAVEPMVTVVDRGPDGSIVGGDHEPTIDGGDVVRPGDTVDWVVRRTVPRHWATEPVTSELYLDPELGQVVSADPVYRAPYEA